MDITPIKTEADYEVALAEIKGLMNAGPESAFCRGAERRGP